MDSQNSEETFGLDQRNQENLLQAFENADIIVKKTYLSSLNELNIVEIPTELKNLDIEKESRFFNITKLIYDKDENYLEKLTNIFTAISISGSSVATIIKSNGTNHSYYMGVINKNSQTDVSTNYEILKGTFEGNFLGSTIENLSNSKFRELNNNIFSSRYGNKKTITSVSGIAGSKLKEDKNIENYIQGLEKLTDSLNEECTIILLADPINNDQINEIRSGYESLYSELVPFLKTELSFNENDTLTLTEGTVKGFTKTINQSISNSQNESETSGWSNSQSKSKTKNYGGIASGVLMGGITAAAIIAAPGVAVAIGASVVGGSVGKVVESAVGSITEGETITDNTSTTTGSGVTETSGESDSSSTQESVNTSKATTKGRNVQIALENRSVKTLLEKVDNQLERLKTCEDYGAFNFSAYIVSDFASTNKVVASAYSSLIKGKDSSVETSHINTWNKEKESQKLIGYLEKMTHPMFELNLGEEEKVIVTPSSLINSEELAISALFPKKSVSGIPVIESTAFGRNIINLDSEEKTGDVNVGKLYHMGKEESIEVSLDKKSLAMHTFITGSTGAGKSNAIYQILDQANKSNVKFMVIEPAKGEYKHVFGNRGDVNVFGTNPYKSKLIKINPFKFSEDIHVLEHIDKLVEIFNVCWPMYAAMPAVLKNAIENAYILAGWDLDESINKLCNNTFPTFIDVLEELRKVVDHSDFSEELKGNYKGALITRVESLTRGINGRIFSSDEIDNETLFDSNVIVDISRSGTETKALLMGILVMRLQEHRMTQGGMNVPLKHITVLEEAHNLLKRTSTEQSSEGANLVGKSVEMIANSIAEMRTYGEGFIIADQSPGLLDMSVIRNTNTKIILRLPDYSDRELVGKSASLSDNQIAELSKLRTGVAAIYQNDWLEPILCKINKVDTEEVEYIYEYIKSELNFDNIYYNKNLLNFLLHERIDEKVEFDIDYLETYINESTLPTIYRREIKKLFKTYKLEGILGFRDEVKFNELSELVCKIIDKKGSFKNIIGSSKSIRELNIEANKELNQLEYSLDEEMQKNIIQCFMNEISSDSPKYIDTYSEWVKDIRGIKLI